MRWHSVFVTAALQDPDQFFVCVGFLWSCITSPPHPQNLTKHSFNHRLLYSLRILLPHSDLISNTLNSILKPQMAVYGLCQRLPNLRAASSLVRTIATLLVSNKILLVDGP